MYGTYEVALLTYSRKSRDSEPIFVLSCETGRYGYLQFEINIELPRGVQQTVYAVWMNRLFAITQKSMGNGIKQIW